MVETACASGYAPTTALLVGSWKYGLSSRGQMSIVTGVSLIGDNGIGNVPPLENGINGDPTQQQPTVEPIPGGPGRRVGKGANDEIG